MGTRKAHCIEEIKMKIFLFLILSVFPLTVTGCQKGDVPDSKPEANSTVEEKFKNGIDVFLDERISEIVGKRVGIVTNHSAITKDGKHLVDALHFDKKTSITAVFGPEHGFRGDAAAGKKIDDSKDEKTGLQVYSLYGATKKPTAQMLNGVDVMIFSIRDVGVRFYTYISTLYYVMEACSEKGIPVIVLDQPNIIEGTYVDGPIVEEPLFSFVGITALPIAHGMTVGELAYFFKDDILKRKNISCTLDVVKMKGYFRETEFSSTGLDWVNPSPNLRSVLASKVYPGTCLLENTNFSEGRGTEEPFLIIGAPFVKSKEFSDAIASFPGIKSVEPIEFTPVESSAATKPKYLGEKCFGARITGINPGFESVKFGFFLLDHLLKSYPGKFEIRENGFAGKAGNNRIREMLVKAGWDAVVKSYTSELQQFKELRNKYLLYTNLR